MKLPFLLGAVAIALVGCRDGGCTANHCTISSMMGNSQTAAPTYQVSTSESPSTYQALSSQTSTYKASTSRSASYIAPGITLGGCGNPGMAGEYHPTTNMVHLCRVLDGAWRRWVIAHEICHAKDWQKDGKFEPDLEYFADQCGVIDLLQQGDCEAVKAKASNSTERESAYTKGIYYAREMYSSHC